ncbi:MAG: hypothetical protein R3315_01515 [Woeseiaceae bacterium]|nr:hypothetical protein [Woeseiaceae bacterium]
MNMWLAIVAIVAIVIGADTWRKVAVDRKRQKADEEEAGNLEARIDELEERIRVLERIVTEDRHDLRREISNL